MRRAHRLHSDFRLVAEYFTKSRDPENYHPSPQIIRHVHEVLQLLRAVTKDERFTEAMTLPEGEGGTVMSECLNWIENRGIRQGMQQGVQQGKRDLLKSMLQAGIITPEQAKQFAEN